MSVEVTLDEHFAGFEESRPLFDAVSAAIATLGDSTTRTTKSQVAFARERAFAWTWIPGRYLRGKVAPLVLSIALGRHDRSDRWKQVVEPAPGRFLHHLELYAPNDVDDQVLGWLAEAWDDAGRPTRGSGTRSSDGSREKGGNDG